MPADRLPQSTPPMIDWSRIIQPGDQLVCSHMTSEPVALIHSLAQAELEIPFGITLGVPFSAAAAELPPSVVLTTFGGMGSAAALARSHRLRISLVPYSSCGAVFGAPQFAERSDIVLVSLARAPDGQLMLGASHGYIIEAARRARQVVVEVNALAPCIYGAAWPADIKVHAMLEVSYPPALAAESVASNVDLRIAEQVAALVPDGACLQVGIGSMPSAVLAKLVQHRHLGAHTGMLTDGMYRLIQSGAMDHSRKGRERGLAVIGSVYGSQELYRYCHLNRSVELREPEFTHSPAVIAQLSDFLALNSAIEVDLLGQVNAEVIRLSDGSMRYVGGVGGLNDFIRAARFAPRGQSIVALPSRTRADSSGKTKIVARLSGPVTVAAVDADLVVTEHGVARLRDATIEHRVQQMLAIADPSEREALTHSARELGLLH